MAGRQAAKIRCRKCDYLIHIAYRGDGDEFDVTATPPTLPPGAAAAGRSVKPGVGQPAMGSAAPRARLPPFGEEGSASRKPTAAVPGLPGLGSAKSTRGAALLSDPSALGRRPLAPLPPPPTLSSSGGSTATVAAFGSGAPPAGAASTASTSTLPASVLSSIPPSARSAPPSTQLGDQFRESVQAGAAEDLPPEGWFVGVNGVPLGPIPLGDLRELALAGHIDRRSLVWREGQGEWRPLGKFPGLARVIEEGVPLPPPQPEPPPPPSRLNGTGSNGQLHMATGFEVKRADAGERPSAWGDLDDEDDDDEQPTTIKGRVSVMPATGSLPAPPPVSLSSAPPPPAPAPPPSQSSPRHTGVTGAISGFPSMAPVAGSLPGAGVASFAPRSTIESGVETEAMLGRSVRNRWYLIVAAIVFAFALGAIVTHLLRPSSDDKASTNTGSRDTSAAGVSSPAEVTHDARAAAREPDPIFGSSGTPTPELRKSRSWGAAGPPRAAGEPRVTPAAGARGLDETALQRTYRRYAPGIRQECWLRALDTRARGVPASAKATASITIAPNGSVRSVAVAGTPKGYPGLARCIERAVGRWQFPRAASATKANAPFVFSGR